MPLSDARKNAHAAKVGHTPGPWTINPNRKYRAHHFIMAARGKENQTVVATVPHHFDEPVQDADASLIAAAPDLLVACEAVVASWERGDLAAAARLCAAAAGKARGDTIESALSALDPANARHPAEHTRAARSLERDVQKGGAK